MVLSDYLKFSLKCISFNKPSVYHAMIIIFLEFFAWGLLTEIVLKSISEAFPKNTLLFNGIIQGVKGILSFICAPVVGNFSDVYGRKIFLIITLFFTCLPMIFLLMNKKIFFVAVAFSGVFAVTFTIVFAYVSDFTNNEKRPIAYGMLSATFAASLIISPALGYVIEKSFGDNVVVYTSILVWLIDMLFISFATPESLTLNNQIKIKFNWNQINPFKSMYTIFSDKSILLLCCIFFLSNISDAGQTSSIILYLKKVVGFEFKIVAIYIAVVGILCVICQTLVLKLMIARFGLFNSLIVSLFFQALQLVFYGISQNTIIIWIAGFMASLSSMVYPVFSSLLSNNSKSHGQGFVQGVATGIRGLCNGFGPAIFGLLFFIFNVDINSPLDIDIDKNSTINDQNVPFKGVPFLIGSSFIFVALFLTIMLSRSFSNLQSSNDFSVLRQREQNETE